ncbi:DUF1697 domain-containing protein [Nocardioides sp. GCM10027113]|uniref:DUF1697 domain-containing protein n=1 Tax=unclassified Nocardioides TaxID=2615069 RepID=UPI00361CDF13
MPTYVGFLRAINLGATRKFPKDAVVAAAEGAGFSDVATHLNTGNVRVSTALRSRARVESALEEAFAADRGFAVPTVVLTPAELRAVAADADALGGGHDGMHYVSFLKEEPTAEGTEALEALARDGERAHVRGRAVHLLVGAEYRSARLTNAAVEKWLGVATNRNVTVVRALAEKWA